MAKVIIYSTGTCGFCHTLKNYLTEKSVKYEEKRVDDDPKLAQELFDLSGQLAVPFTLIETDDGKKANVSGFDRPKLDELLGLT